MFESSEPFFGRKPVPVSKRKWMLDRSGNGDRVVVNLVLFVVHLLFNQCFWFVAVLLLDSSCTHACTGMIDLLDPACILWMAR